MLLDIAIAFSCAGGGLACGWALHAFGAANVSGAAMRANPGESSSGDQTNSEPTQEQISEVAERLRGFASSMAADVDAHQSKVQAVNNSLHENHNADSPEAIFDAITQLIEANEKMQLQLQSSQDRINEQAIQLETAERRAQTDALTRVANRRAFDEHFAKRHKFGAGKAGTLAILDVDHFKQFNDVYGHRAGDEVLRIVAGVLHARLQPYGMVARFGGEEFAVIMDGCSIDKCEELIESARVAIGVRDIQFEDKRLRVTACAGIAELAIDESMEQWLQRADDALYYSKEHGRNCGHWMDGTTPVPCELAPTEAAKESEENLPGSTKKKKQAAQPAESRGTKSRSTGAGEDDAAAQPKPEPNAFAYLPDRNTLCDAFSDMHGRTQSASMSMYVMAVRCNSDASSSSMRSLLQIVRATLRTVDRIGCEDDSTILVCMPSVDEATAYERGRQICRSAEAIRLGSSSPDAATVSIGLAEAAAGEEFDAVVSRVTSAAESASEEEGDPVRVAGQPAGAR